MAMPDGVYLGLDFETYKAQDAMGSTHKATLWLRREGYFWRYLSPYRAKDKSSPEQVVGTALHAALLEGMHAYDTRFCVAPSKLDYPDALMTVEEIKRALREVGAPLGSTAGWKKDDWADAAEAYLPGVEVWDNLQAEFERRQGARTPIPADEDYAIRAMHALAVAERPGNEYLRELLSVGMDFPILAEVSVFWTDEHGTRHRARFDKLLPVATVDLKSIGNWQGEDLGFALDGHVKRMGYDVQVADYHIARQKAFAMVLADEANLHGGTEEVRDHFIAMAQWCQTRKPDWCWLWYQKPSAAGNGPILLPVREVFGGPYHRAGYRKRHEAMALYRRCMDEFGPDRPWGRTEVLHYTVERPDAPHVTLGPYDWGPLAPVDGEAEYFEDGRH